MVGTYSAEDRRCSRVSRDPLWNLPSPECQKKSKKEKKKKKKKKHKKEKREKSHCKDAAPSPARWVRPSLFWGPAGTEH